MNSIIRNEKPGDADAISRIIRAAFANDAHSSHTEEYIVAALRKALQLSVSLVALEGERVVGHVAISPVSISSLLAPSGIPGWYGLGPIAVSPERQGQGIGSALMRASLAALQQQGACGCVVLGEPGYYARFGFTACPQLVLPGVPQKYFQALSFAGDVPEGEVAYHSAFAATA